jgi:hypothetical protein
MPGPSLEVGLDALEVGDGFVEAGELLFDFGDDFALRRSTAVELIAYSRLERCSRRDSARIECAEPTYHS